jgi:hypothetical protein
MASSAHTLMQLEFQEVIYSFGLDEAAQLSHHAAALYADIFARLNKRLAGVTPEIIQTTSVDYSHGYSRNGSVSGADHAKN